MTKQQFLTALAEKLNVLDPAERDKILNFYAQMLDERIEDGMTEEEAVATMEPVDAIADEILAEHEPTAICVQEPAEEVAAEKPRRKLRKGWIIAIVATVGALISLATGMSSMVFNINGHDVFGGFFNRKGAIGSEIVEEITEEIVDEFGEEAPIYSDNNGTAGFKTEQTEFVEVFWEAGDVYVTASDVQEITVREEGALADKHPMVLATGQGGLTVKYAERNVFSNVTNLLHVTDTKDLYIEVPESWNNTVEVNVSVGTVTVEGGSFEQITVNANMGDVQLRNVDATHVRIDADMGNVDADVHFYTLCAYLDAGDFKLTAQDASGRIEMVECDMGRVVLDGDYVYACVENDMGDVEVTASDSLQGLEVSCDMGAATVTLPEDLGFRMEADTDMGDVDIDFPVTMSTHDGEHVYTFGDEACPIDIDCDMGQITIRHN